jgi:PAS domain-containing protein
MKQSRSRGNASSIVLPVATAVVAIAIFIADTATGIAVAAAGLYVVVVLMAARFLSARGVILVGVGCVGLTALSYTLSPPPTGDPAETANPLVCLVTILLTTLLVLRAQKASAALQEQASLLNQTHDAIFVRNMNDVITYWNRGAQELYGWKAEDAIGKSSHELLRTIFPAPLDELRGGGAADRPVGRRTQAH